MSDVAFLLEKTIIKLGVLRKDMRYMRSSFAEMSTDIEEMERDLKVAVDSIYEEWEK